MTTTKPTTAIEVWLTQKNLEISCMIVNENESTDEIGVESLSMRGAQREVTGYLVGRGYEPVGRWESVEEDRNVYVDGGGGGFNECLRRFRPAKG